MTDRRPGEGAGRPTGWFYVGDGRLRYRDEHGWTEYHMDTHDPRARSWPPPPPRELLQQLHDDLREASPAGAPDERGRRRHRFGGLHGRRRHRR